MKTTKEQRKEKAVELMLKLNLLKYIPHRLLLDIQAYYLNMKLKANSNTM